MFSKRYVVANSSNINTLSALLSPAAEAGNPSAQTNLGDMFYSGEGVQANPVKAVEWYQKGMLSWILKILTLSALLSLAAEAGNPSAQFNLGEMYILGKGVEMNPVKAFEWIQKGMLLWILQNIDQLSALLSPAAEAGLPEAQFHLGQILHKGKGVEANPAKAFEWYQKGVLSRILQNINTLSMHACASFASRGSRITRGSNQSWKNVPSWKRHREKSDQGSWMDTKRYVAANSSKHQHTPYEK
jgi:TPR repeat protein